jgi:hypothetical protein
VAKHELSEASRGILRKYWPPHQPRYWTPDEESFQKFWDEAHRQPDSHYSRNPLSNNERIGDYAWSYAEPATDGLPTRAGGGTLRSLDRQGLGKARNPPYKPPIIYPVQFGATLPFYQTKDADPSSPLWARIDLRSGATQGFAYCQVKLPWFGNNATDGWRSAEHLLPGFKKRPLQIFIDDELISQQLSPAGNRSALTTTLPIFERDQFMLLKASAYH